MTWPGSGNGSFLRRGPTVLAGVAVVGLCLGVVVRLQAGTLSAIAPSGASATVSIQVTGTGFDGTAANHEVTFRATSGETAVAIPTAVAVINAAQGLRRLTLRVPAGLPIGRADVTVVNRITGEASTGLWLEVVGLTLPEVTSGAPGATNLRVRITGSANAKFAAGSRAIFGTGITVSSTTVESPTSVVATLSIAATAAVGPRTVTVVTTTQTVSLIDGFLVSATPPPPPPPLNTAPTVNAGADQAITLPAGTTLTGSVSDDGLPAGAALAIVWTQVSGPGTAAFGSPTAATSTVTFSEAGPYVLRLTGSDGALAAADEVTVVVSPAPPPPNRTPSANAGGPYAVIAGQLLTFTGSGSDPDSGDTLTLTWAFGDGDSGVGATPTHTYATAGPFTATLTVTDGRGGSATAQASVVVTNPPPVNRNPAAHAGGPYAATVGAAIAFSGAASLDPDPDTLSFAWLFGDGSAGAGVAPTHAFAAPGTYTVTLLVGDGHGGTDTATTIVQVRDVAAAGNRDPAAAAGGPYAGVRGQSVGFDAGASTDPDSDPLTFAWNFGDGESGTGQAPAHTYAEAGEYAVSLLVADGRGGSDLASARVLVSAPAVAGNQLPTVGAGGPYAGLTGSPVALSATGSDPDGDALIFAWSFGDGSSGSGPTPSHAYLEPGPYTVVVTVSDQRGGSAMASTTTEISGVAGNTAPIAAAGGPYLGAPGQEIAFNFAASSDADQDPLIFNADFGDGGTGAGSGPTHTYAQPGTYVVTLVVSDGRGGANVATTSAVIVGQTTPQNRGPVANAGGPYAAAPAQLVQFDGSNSSDPDADPLTFSWSFGDGDTGDTATPAHVYANPGQYSVALLLTDGRGGTAAATATVIVTAVAAQNQLPTGTAGGPYSATLGDIVMFAGAGSDPDGDAVSLSWNFGDGSTGSGLAPEHRYPREGDYAVVLLISDGRGGSATVDSRVRVTARATANQSPVANAGGPYAGVPQSLVVFDGSLSTDPDGDALSFNWNFGDGTNGSGAAPSHVYSSAGAYAVSLTVTDARGTAAASSTSAVIGTVVDRGPPIVTLSAPTEALPGASVVVTATAADDVAVTAVTFEVSGAATSEATTAPYRRTVQVPTVAAPGAVIHIRAIARDPSNNTGQADADLRITVQPDTENPRVSLILPPSATPGTSVPVSATALDNVGVARVVFLVAGTPISEDAQAPYEATVLVPAHLTAGSALPIAARAVDFSGNTVEGGSTLAIVSEADTIAPTVSLTAPAEILRGGTLQVTATAADNAAVYGVTFYVNDVPLATDTTTPYAASLQLGAGQPAGTILQLRVVARDFSGLEGVATAQSLITAPAEGGRGILTGEVYDDSSGLPLASAVVVLTGSDDSGAPYAESTSSDARGRYILRANTGVGVLQVTRPGWTRVDRPVTVVAQRAVEVVDARLTRVSTANAAISPVLGGVVGLESDRLTMPPGALQAAATLALTPISQQGLQGLLPPGWSPVGGADVTPHELTFNGVAQLRVSNRFGLAAGIALVVARWDDTASAWRAVGATIAGGPADGLQADVAGGGQYAWLFADRVPSAPSVPALGDLLAGTSGAVIPPQTTPRIDPQPRVAFYNPGISSAVRAFVDTAAALPSGSVLWIDVSETYRFFSGAETHPEPYVQDLVFYQTPDNPLSQSASFPATPSLVFDALTLERGVITLDMLVPPAMPAPPALAGPDGGVITSGDASLTIPAGALGDFAPIELHGLQQTDLGIALPPGLAFLGGAQIGFPGTLASSAALSLPAPSGSADSVLLVRLHEIQGQTRLVLAGLGSVTNGRLVSIVTAGGSTGLEGVRSAGRYVFFRASTAVGFASGQILGVGGAPFPAALVTTPGLPIVSLSGPSGTYLAAAPAGAATLTALDVARSDSGAATATLVAAQVSPLDIRLVAQAPRVLSIVPAANAQNVPLGTPIVVTFSEPVDPASVASGGVVTLAPAGGSAVPGAFLLASGNTVLTFRPDLALEPNRRYTATVGTSIRDLAGYALGAPVSSAFDSLDTLPPPQPPAGTLGLTIPVNGATMVSATQGTAGARDTVSVVNVTRNSSTPVLLEPNGGFSVRVEAGLNDRLQLKMVDQSGNETVVPLGRFRDPDGSVVVGSEGGIVEGPNGSALEVEPGTFPTGSIIRFIGLSEAEINTPMTPEYPFVAGFEITSSATPQRYINLSVPAPPGVGPLQQGIVAKVVTAFGQPALSIVDTAKIIDGRLRTSSPPCPGILERFGRYAMFLNNDEAMQQFGIALLSMAVPRTTTVSVPEIIIQPFWVSVPPFYLSPPLQFDVPYYPATPFVAHILTQGTPLALGQALVRAAEVCLPVPADRPLKIVVRNAVSGQIIQAANQTAPPAGTSQPVVTDYVDPSDSERPSLYLASWSPQPPHVLEPDAPISLIFSERVQLLASQQEPEPVYLLTAGLPGQPMVRVMGTANVDSSGRVLTFQPAHKLEMGKFFTLQVPGVRDLAGNRFQLPTDPALTFKTFEPYVVMPSGAALFNRDKMYADLLQNANPPFDSALLPEAALRDLGFVTRTPDESADGKWHTTLSAIVERRGLGYKILNVDASDPRAPVALNALTGGDRIYPRLKVYQDFYMTPRLSPLGGDPANITAWRNRILHYVVEDPSLRICIDPAALPAVQQAWQTAHTAPNHTFATRTGGCGHLGISASYSIYFSIIHFYDLFDPHAPTLLGQRTVSDNGSLFSPPAPRRSWAPAGGGFARGLDILPNIDFTHEVGGLADTNLDTVGVYIPMNGLGLGAIDLERNVPTISDFVERIQRGGTVVESEAFYGFPYYQDVSVVRGKIVAVSSDNSDGTGLQLLEVFDPTLATRTGVIPLSIKPRQVTSVEALLQTDADGNGTPENHDIAFVSGFDGGLALVEIDPSGAAALVGQVATPTLLHPDVWGTVVTALRHVEVDKEAMLAYVGAAWHTPQGEYSGIMVVDVRSALGPFSDTNNDQRDDRILALVPVLGPGQAAGLGGILWEFRFDSQRKLIYAAVDASVKDGAEHGLAILKTCECSALDTDITLTTGVVRASNGTQTSFPSADGTSATLFVTTGAQGGQVRATFEVDFGVDQAVTYTITEVPFGAATETILDLSTGATGVFDLSNPLIVMSLNTSGALVRGSLVYVDFLNDQGVVLKRAALVLLPARVIVVPLRLTTRMDRINGEICEAPDFLQFAISDNAEVTIRIDGHLVPRTGPNGENLGAFENVLLPVGLNRVMVTRDLVTTPGEHQVEIIARFRQTPEVIAIGRGTITHEVIINESLPVGHTFVKGVDLYDGHVAIQREDLTLPGLGPKLQFARTYSSLGNRSSGVMGAGWTHSYQSFMTADSCGGLALVGGEGSGIRFTATANGFRPQAGYHGTLEMVSGGGAYDFYTKNRTRYRYVRGQPNTTVEYRLAFIEDPHGNRLSLSYAALAPFNLATVTDAGNRSLNFTYETSNPIGPEERLTRVDGPLGLSVTFQYDGHSNLVSATRGVRHETYAYSTDAANLARDPHNLVETVGPNGDVTQYVYHADSDAFAGENTSFLWGREVLVIPQKYELVKQVVEGGGLATTEFAFDYSLHQTQLTTTVTDPRSIVTRYTQGPRGNVREQRVLASSGDVVTTTRWSFEQNPPINDVFVTEKTDANGRVTRYAYDAGGNMITETIVAGSSGYAPVSDSGGTTINEIIARSEYDPTFNTLTRHVDPNGNITTSAIDPANGNLLSETTHPAGGVPAIVRQFTYRPNGLPQTTTDGRGSTTTYAAYNTDGLPTEIVDPEGNTAATTYDARGRLLTQTDTTGRSATYTYDDLDRVTSVTKRAGAQPSDPALVSADRTTLYELLPGGEIATETDGLGHTTTYTYDGMNRPTTEVDTLADADGNPVVLTKLSSYDGVHKTGEVDRRGIARTFVYDDLNRLTALHIENTVTAVYTYDAFGNRVTETDLHGHTTRMHYDMLYRVVRTELPQAPFETTIDYDAVGNVRRSTDANGRVTGMTYDGLNRLTAKTDAVDNTLSYTYDAANNIIREQNAHSGLTVEYSYDALNRPLSMTQRFTDPLSGALVAYTTTHTYDDVEHTKTSVNPRGIANRERSNGNDQVIERITDTSGLSITKVYGYDGNGNHVAEKDSTGSAVDVAYVYDGLGRKVKTLSALGGEELMFYDGNDNLTREVNQRGIVTRHEYDTLDRKLREVLVESVSGGGAELAMTTVAFDDGANTLTVTDARGNATTQAFDALHREVLVTDPRLHTVQTEWDGVSKVMEIDRRGIRREFEYDGLNRPTVTREFDTAGAPATTVTSLYVDQENRRVETDRRGVQTMTQMDALQRIRRVSRAHPGLAATYGAAEVVVEESEFDGNGNRISIRDANGNLTLLGYDAADRANAVRHGAGSAVAATTTYTHDDSGNILTIKDGRAHGGPFDQRYTYDERNRRLSEENAAGGTRAYTYDRNDNLASMTEAMGGDHVTRYSYDELDKLLSVDESRGGAGGVTLYQYDANRNKIAQQDGSGRLTTYSYEALNRLTEVARHAAPGNLVVGGLRTANAGGDAASASSMTYAYDENGNPVLLVDAEGQRVAKTYDYLNRITRSDYSHHSSGSTPAPLTLLSIAYEQDGNGNLTRAEERKQMDAATIVSEITAMAYDPLERLVMTTNPDGKVIRYAYDRQGNRTAITDADGVQTTYAYDARNRMASTTAELGSTTGTTLYMYFADDQPRLTTYPNGSVADMSYDAADRLTSLINHSGDPANPISQFAYTYDLNSNRLSQTERHRNLMVGSEQTRYEYDAMNRLTNTIYASGNSVGYTFAANGNRLTESGVDPVTQASIDRVYQYNGLNELTAIVNAADPTASVTLSHDRNGNNIGRETGTFDAGSGQIPAPTASRAFSFDIRDRLVSATATGGGSESYDYDYQGRRSKATGAFTNVRFVYDGTDVVQEYNGATQITSAKYNYQERGLLSLVSPGPARSSVFYLFDGLGSTSELTDEVGAIQGTFVYDVWGGLRMRASTTGNRRLFTGQYRDTETGLQYFKSRYYDSDTGRFMSMDPLFGDSTNPSTQHRYSYAFNNPTTYHDPSGEYVESWWDVASLAAGAVSFGYNVKEGNGWAAAVDAVGIVVDAAAVLLPVPGGAGFAIKASRAANVAFRTAKIGNQTLNVLQGAGEAYLSFEDGNYGWAAFNGAVAFIGVGGLKNEVGQLSKRIQGTVTEGSGALSKVSHLDRIGGGPKSGPLNAFEANRIANNADLRIQYQKNMPSSGVHSGDREIIGNFLNAKANEGLEIGIRATDPLSAARTRAFASFGENRPKGLDIKAKSDFGGMQIKDGSGNVREFIRSDYDIAWVRDTKTGKLLSNEDVLKRIKEPLNAQMKAAGRMEPFQHGSHLTAFEVPAVGNKGYLGIDAPGAVEVFGGGGTTRMMSAGDVYQFAVRNNAWHPNWKMPWQNYRAQETAKRAMQEAFLADEAARRIRK